MTELKVGTRQEWQTTRDELARLEAEHAELGRKVAEKRRELPWVLVEKKYAFDTEEGKKTLAELFDGRLQRRSSASWRSSPTSSSATDRQRSGRH